ncbi:XdhC family protein [Planktothrix sp. FACHB-1365]|uniref:XdhC family protein n=1 Tax=Planktothrix sp. FACHB-1365 TaxID=2692855 RepID=UPI0016878CAE|nr:XdhC/CoxI family protein [Planktothrix sp. FACHB-1365]MBD2485163.1 XdhC family protein [Planktothrix sp. FACHB-1365]
MIIQFYQQLIQVLYENAAVVATVTRVIGSVPRELGAKMIICEDGRTFNTVGGGAGEAKVIQQAREVLKTGEKQWVDIDLSGAPQRETQGVCGGLMQVLLERWSGEKAIALAENILSLLQAGKSIMLVTSFDAAFPYLLTSEHPIPASDQIFIETLQPPPTLLIIGAGHIGEKLAKIADFMGFKIIIQDSRPEFTSPERFPPNSLIFNQNIATVLQQLTSPKNLYIALVTRGYEYDIEALKSILNINLPYQYIGMIGSQKRIQVVYKALQNCGIYSHQLQAIHSPIGLDIGALTPEEIAISIAAELIQVYRSKR